MNPTDRNHEAVGIAEAPRPAGRRGVVSQRRALSSPVEELRLAKRPVPDAEAVRESLTTRNSSSRVLNAFTIDLEDWPIAVIGPHCEITSRVVENTRRCLQILQWHGVKATFFVLTSVAEKFPELIREVCDGGHEIASHGHGHELLFNMTPESFRRDVARSVEILTEITGERPTGYRAPAFSVVETTRWAGPILAELGFKYDSSVFPIRHRRYGIPNALRRIHRWGDCDLIECPPATCRVFGTNLPVAGGGYFRLLPGSVVRTAVRLMNREGMPAILYMHPYEIDVDGVMAHRRGGVQMSNWRHFTQSLFRERIEERLHRLLRGFQFQPLRELIVAS